MKHLCQFVEETEHGYKTVEVVADGDKSYCEVGLDCIARCPHAFTQGAQTAAIYAFMKYFGICLYCGAELGESQKCENPKCNNARS